MRGRRLIRGFRSGESGKDSGTSRQSPTDIDAAPEKPAPVLTFDLAAPFPERYHGRRFGPALIDRSLAAGNYIIAELVGLPGQFPISSARWQFDVLEVLTINGWRLPARLFTLTTLKGFKL